MEQQRQRERERERKRERKRERERERERPSLAVRFVVELKLNYDSFDFKIKHSQNTSSRSQLFLTKTLIFFNQQSLKFGESLKEIGWLKKKNILVKFAILQSVKTENAKWYAL